MHRDNFACQRCGDTKTTLNVHHKKYLKGKAPWEYSNDLLETLCEPCHGKEHEKPAAVPFVARKVYLAGKISRSNEWRDSLLNGKNTTRGMAVVGYCGDGNSEPFPSIVIGAVRGGHHYTGPFYVSCDHGCFHGRAQHGAAPYVTEGKAPEPFSEQRKQILDRSLKGIESADLVFAWIDSQDCFGTLAEIGYARALGKPVYVAVKKGMDIFELWFSLNMATHVSFVEAPLEAFDLPFRPVPFQEAVDGFAELRKMMGRV